MLKFRFWKFVPRNIAALHEWKSRDSRLLRFRNLGRVSCSLQSYQEHHQAKKSIIFSWMDDHFFRRLLSFQLSQRQKSLELRYNRLAFSKIFTRVEYSLFHLYLSKFSSEIPPVCLLHLPFLQVFDWVLRVIIDRTYLLLEKHIFHEVSNFQYCFQILFSKELLWVTFLFDLYWEVRICLW